MKTRSAITFGPLTLGLSVLMLGGTIAAVQAGASAREQSRAEKQGRIEASAPGQLEALKGAVARHLDRFAFREAPLTFDWVDVV